MKRLTPLLCLALCAGSITQVGSGAAAAAPKLPDLNQSYLFTSAGHLTPLHAETTYQASLFPIPLRVSVPTPL